MSIYSKYPSYKYCIHTHLILLQIHFFLQQKPVGMYAEWEVGKKSTTKLHTVLQKLWYSTANKICSGKQRIKVGGGEKSMKINSENRIGEGGEEEASLYVAFLMSS